MDESRGSALTFCARGFSSGSAAASESVGQAWNPSQEFWLCDNSSLLTPSLGTQVLSRNWLIMGILFGHWGSLETEIQTEVFEYIIHLNLNILFKQKYCLCVTALPEWRRRDRMSPQGFGTLWWAGWGTYSWQRSYRGTGKVKPRKLMSWDKDSLLSEESNNLNKPWEMQRKSPAAGSVTRTGQWGSDALMSQQPFVHTQHEFICRIYFFLVERSLWLLELPPFTVHIPALAWAVEGTFPHCSWMGTALWHLRVSVGIFSHPGMNWSDGFPGAHAWQDYLWQIVFSILEGDRLNQMIVLFAKIISGM